MIRAALLLPLAFLLLGAASPDEAGMRLAAAVRGAVVRVDGPGGPRRLASGVVTGSGRVVLTWSAGWSRGAEVSLSFPGGVTRKGEVLARDRATGVTAVRLLDPVAEGVLPRAGDLAAGEPVAVAGHAFGTLRGEGGAAVALGILAQVRRADTGDRYLLTSAVNPGEFGGLLADRNGRLAGILLRRRDPLTGFSTAVPVSTLREAFRDHEEVVAALTPSEGAEPLLQGAWPIHDRLKLVAEAVCPSVLSLVEEVAEGSDDKPRIVTALLVDGEGHAVTTRANLTGIRTFRAVFPDGREFPAERRGEDVRLGIVMVRIEGDSLPKPPDFAGDLPPIGSFVVALGNPNGRDRGAGCLLTMGIVGARNRSARSQGPMQYRALHTDAGVNRGNLGGPLIDLSGRVVGVLSSLGGASLTEVGANSGIGFAIPTRLLAPSLEPLRRGEKIEFRPGYLGVSLSFTPAEGGGVLVTAAQPGFPAARSGVKANDVIVGADGESIAAYEDLRRLFSEFEEDQTVRLSVRRGEDMVELDVTLGPWPRRR